MKLFLSFFLNFIIILSANAQVFKGETGAIQDFPGVLYADTFKVAVSGIRQKIDFEYGLSKVCLRIGHTKSSDLKIELFSPDGNEIWLSNRNGGDNGQNYYFTCFSSNGFNGYIHEGTAPFYGEYIPDGRMEFINNGQNPNGEWKLLVRDLESTNTGYLESIELFFDTNPIPNYLKPPCSESSPQGCQCSDEESDCKLLPDMVILPAFTQNQIKEYPYNHYRYPGQLRLAATIANIGNGPVEVFGKDEWFCGDTPSSKGAKCSDGSYPRQKIYQRVYEKSNDSITFKDIEAGTNYYDDKPGHDHFHVDDWVEFRLVKEKSNSKGKIKRDIIADGQKVSYCLFDTGICNNNDSLCLVNGVVYGKQNLKNYGLGNFTSCTEGVQGISVGGYDTYGMLYEGQFIQLPKRLKSGKYILEIEVDPEKNYFETDISNNTYSQEVEISKQRKRPRR
jgi:subtilisin-like proprotein convertase family protein